MRATLGTRAPGYVEPAHSLNEGAGRRPCRTVRQTCNMEHHCRVAIVACDVQCSRCILPVLRENHCSQRLHALLHKSCAQKRKKWAIHASLIARLTSQACHQARRWVCSACSSRNGAQASEPGQPLALHLIQLLLIECCGRPHVTCMGSTRTAIKCVPHAAETCTHLGHASGALAMADARASAKHVQGQPLGLTILSIEDNLQQSSTGFTAGHRRPVRRRISIAC